MHLLTWILIGTLIGWGTGKSLKGNGYGPFKDVFLGPWGFARLSFVRFPGSLYAAGN